MAKTKRKAAFTPEEGLLKFYSSQASLLLAQYEHITHLLGETADWTGPGTHCEVLIRDFLRKVLPSSLSVDKGFVYGGIDAKDFKSRCPEIDILIHNTRDYTPIFQMDDFVIVQPTAARAVIQVKRVMQATQLEKALQNVRDAKAYLRSLNCASPNEFFSGVVFFQDDEPRKDGKPKQTYANVLQDFFADRNTWGNVPDFVGSLKHTVFYPRFRNAKAEFAGGPATQGGHNISLQVFLIQMCKSILNSPRIDLPFSLPDQKLPDSWVISIAAKDGE